MEEVETESRLLVTTPEVMGGGALPVVLFEPRQAVAMHLDDRTTEAQAECIIRSGFRRFLIDDTSPAPRLPH